MQTVLTRKNTVTGLIYKDDPTIFSWELMNEPRSLDLSGKQIQVIFSLICHCKNKVIWCLKRKFVNSQDWVREMAAYVKSIDKNHLLQVGLEGFYGESRRTQFNPAYNVGTDFISNNLVPEIDYATLHLYPQW